MSKSHNVPETAGSKVGAGRPGGPEWRSYLHRDWKEGRGAYRYLEEEQPLQGEEAVQRPMGKNTPAGSAGGPAWPEGELRGGHGSRAQIRNSTAAGGGASEKGATERE